MVPPVHVGVEEVHAPPFPATVNVPVVVLSDMPFEPPPALTFWNVTLSATLARLTAVPAVVLRMLPLPVARIVPPPVPLNATPDDVVRVNVPPKLIAAPVFVVRLIAFCVLVFAVMLPLRLVVPPVLEEIDTAFAADA